MELPPDPLAGARLLRPPPLIQRPWVVLPVEIDPTGRAGPTRQQSRGKAWRRVAPNRFVPTDARFRQPGQRIIEAAEYVKPYGAVTGWASLNLARAPYFEGQTSHGDEVPVLLALGRHGQVKPRQGFTVTRRAFDESEVVHRHGVRCLNVHRSMLDEITQLGTLDESVRLIDMCCHAELTTIDRFCAYLATVPQRLHGLRLALEAVRWAAEGAESPPEVALRLVWHRDLGLNAPLCNRELFTPDGKWLARPDLFDPDRGVAGEYDGDHHASARQRSKDRTRESRLRSAGLEYFSVVAGELAQPSLVRRRIFEAVARAQRNRVPPAWTLTSPNPPELTLAERVAARLGPPGRLHEARLRDIPESWPLQPDFLVT